MKNIFFLFFLVHFSIYSQSSKKHSTFFEAGINNSFLEGEYYENKNFKIGPNLGYAFSYGLVYSKNPKINFEASLSIINKNLLVSIEDFSGIYINTHRNLCFFIGVSKNIKSNLLAGIGVDLDLVVSDDGKGGTYDPNGLSFEVVNKASRTPIYFPLVFSLEHIFTSKKGRRKSLLFKAKKGFQVVESYSITNFLEVCLVPFLIFNT